MFLLLGFSFGNQAYLISREILHVVRWCSHSKLKWVRKCPIFDSLQLNFDDFPILPSYSIMKDGVNLYLNLNIYIYIIYIYTYTIYIYNLKMECRSMMFHGYFWDSQAAGALGASLGPRCVASMASFSCCHASRRGSDRDELRSRGSSSRAEGQCQARAPWGALRLALLGAGEGWWIVKMYKFYGKNMEKHGKTMKIHRFPGTMI